MAEEKKTVHAKVLLVDDEKEFTDVFSERMQSRGANVESAENGKEALEKIKKSSSYDAIILDLSMPGMDGIETLKKLREVNPDLQVIMLTGHGTIQKGIEAVRLGALDFMEKPADIHKIIEKVNEARSNKMLLVQKKSEEQMKKLLQEKGW